MKEARQLGCNSFDGATDARAAKEWLKRVLTTFEDMGIEDDLKLKVAVRLLQSRASTWWETLKGRSDDPLTWSDFCGSLMKNIIHGSTGIRKDSSI